MGFLSRLFGRRNKKRRRTTADNPFVIDNPVIGFLNLQGDRGEALADADRHILAPLFTACPSSTSAVPQCQVLFVYCTVNSTGQIEGSDRSLRDIIKTAGAYIAVVATENDVDAYVGATSGGNDWTANIVLTLDRRGDKFPLFYERLFTAMGKGTSMLLAWVELAPQIPDMDHTDCPEAMMLAEAGHLTFSRAG